MRDSFGRSIEYLRISVTDRCNLRCRYCMPLEGMPWLPNPSLLSDDEIVAVVAQLAPMGLKRIRITGGEPTLRPTLPSLIAQLRAIPSIEDIALSTNGIKFIPIAKTLRDAGLDRVNISSDSLDPFRIASIARRNISFEPAKAIEAALEAGLTPVKLNVVVMRGVNDDEIESYGRLTFQHPVHVRFIELMPVGDLAEGTDQYVVPSDEVIARVQQIQQRPLIQDIGPKGNGPARYFRLDGAQGTVGVISPMTHSYCTSCNRVRLTADGRLRTCLFGDHEVDLRMALREGQLLEPIVTKALAQKPFEHALLRRNTGGLIALSQTGG